MSSKLGAFVMRDELVELLKTKPFVNVKFTKVDGSVRDLKCTLNSEFLPVVETAGVAKVRPANTRTLAVYDLDSQAWKSFIVENVISITYEGKL